MHLSQGRGFAILALYFLSYLLPSVSLYLSSRIASRFCVALLLTIFTCRCALRRGFTLHFCLPSLLCCRALRLVSCFCICVVTTLLLQMTHRFSLFAYALKASSWRMQGAFTTLSLLRRELSWKLALHPRLRRGIPRKDPGTSSTQSRRRVGVRANFAGVLLRNLYPVYRGRYRLMRGM
jgi:hypothetical protein